MNKFSVFVVSMLSISLREEYKRIAKNRTASKNKGEKDKIRPFNIVTI